MRSQPAVCVLTLLTVLLPPAVAWAQPRLLPGRSATVTGSPAEPAPEIHALVGVTAVIHFDADIDPGSVQVEPTRIKIVDAGPRTILFTLLLELSPAERLGLGVRYTDGAAPAEARFVIVSRPPVADTVLSVRRRQQPLAECQAELAQARRRAVDTSAPVWSLVDRLAGGTVIMGRISSGVDVSAYGEIDGSAYQLTTGLLVTLKVAPRPGQPPWEPVSAVLKRGQTSTPARVAVRTIAGDPAGGLEVVIEAEVLLQAGLEYMLELSGTDGGTRTLGVELTSPPKEKGKAAR